MGVEPGIRRLYHFSEDPSVEVFVPRVPPHRPDIAPLVWAVHPDHAWTYCFPRECPRVLAWATPKTTDDDLRMWCHDGVARPIACIEAGWLERMRTISLYRYEFEPAGFAAVEGDAWMWVSAEAQRPVAITPLGDLVEMLLRDGVELRIMPSLVPLKNAWTTTMHISGIRLRNAVGWA